MTDSLGTSGVTSYGCDSAQRLTTIARSIGGSTVAAVGLTYDAASRVTAISRTQSGIGTNVASSLAYDSADRVTTLTHQVSGGATLDSFVYGYDSGGRLKTETNTEGLATYGYDAANQLTSVTRPAGQTNESYSYDSGGNRTMTGYTTGVGNELLASPGATYAYDAEGNMAAKTETSTGNVWSYTYDIRNRLTGVTEKNSGGTVIYQASYTYDALDRRIATTVNGTTTWTVYDGQNTYADFSGAGTLKTRYLYGPAIDELLARTDSGGTTAWYLTDRLGSVRDLASTSGAALDHLAYDAYGNIVSESQPSNGDRFKWTAREWDGTTGLQFNRHRYYAPSVGRWTQVDPVGFMGHQSNLFVYIQNKPVANRDALGEQDSYYSTSSFYSYLQGVAQAAEAVVSAIGDTLSPSDQPQPLPPIPGKELPPVSNPKSDEALQRAAGEVEWVFQGGIEVSIGRNKLREKPPSDPTPYKGPIRRWRERWIQGYKVKVEGQIQSPDYQYKTDNPVNAEKQVGGDRYDPNTSPDPAEPKNPKRPKLSIPPG